jgi:hypothetical protein
MTRGALLFCVSLIACSGSVGPEPRSGSDYDDEDDDIEASQESDEPSGSESASGSKEDTSGEQAGSSQDELRTVLQLVLDDPELDPYLRLGEPGRFPLKVSGDIPQGMELTKATKPVVIVGAPESDADPVLVFTEISIAGKRATVRYRYGVEKIRGSATLDRREHGWELTNSRIVERKQ